ncbi:MAG: ATP-binding protein [Candidatus Woesearchaeota archaeon]
MIQRQKLFDTLLKQSKNNKVSLLIGARQVGKTTLIKQLFEELTKNKKCLFLDVDILSNYEKVNSYENLLNTLKLNGYDENQKELYYLFLDEFQKYPSLTKVMKNVYDNKPNIKIYASGSSSLAIKNQAQESLAGRKHITEIFPLDFEEFLIFKGETNLVQNIHTIKKLSGKGLANSLQNYERLLEEFMIFGGYPEVVLQKTKQEKQQTLTNIFDLYVKKDLLDYLNNDKVLNIKRLIEALAVNNGQKIKYEELANSSGLNFHAIKKYIEILSETYLIKEVRPFFTNKNKELVKIPKVYFIDNGVKNYFINNYNPMHLRSDTGFLFEGFMYSELLKQNYRNIKFWNDKNLEEVDFVLEHSDELIPIEIKYKKELKASDFSGLKNFLKNYKKIKRAYLVNLDEKEKINKIHTVLPYRIAKEIS